MNNRGFTIVELLIVIVVIAILAAITLVTYNGVRQNAENSRIASIVNTYEKALRLYAVDNGSLPAESGCLGAPEDYPAVTGFSNGACIMVNGTASSSYDSASMNALTSFLSTKPSAKIPPVSINFSGDIYNYRGIWFASTNSNNSTIYELQYVLPGQAKCPVGDADYQSQSNATRCMVVVDE